MPTYIWRRFQVYIVLTVVLVMSTVMLLQTMIYQIAGTRRFTNAKRIDMFDRSAGGLSERQTESETAKVDGGSGKYAREVRGVRFLQGPLIYRGENLKNYNDDDKDDESDNEDEDYNDEGEDAYKNPGFGPNDFPESAQETRPPFQYQEINKQNVEKIPLQGHVDKMISQGRTSAPRLLHLQRKNDSHRKRAKLKSGVRTAIATNLFTADAKNSTSYTDGHFWTSQAEKLIPKGFSMETAKNRTCSIQHSFVTEISPASWNRCGRAKNGYAVMTNGIRFCVRYRFPHQNLILGEVLSYYLARLLGIDNVPLVVLSQTGVTRYGQWSAVNYSHLGWAENITVALIEWHDGLNSLRSRVRMPPLLLDALFKNSTLYAHSLPVHNLTKSHLAELVQWGEMIIFDYITGNYDRVASMQDGAAKEGKPRIIAEFIRNLRMDEATSKLWLIDNESGLFDAYDLLYRNYRSGPSFYTFHERMLTTLCIFKHSTVTNLRNLLTSVDPHSTLVAYARQYEPLLRGLLRTPLYEVFVKYFRVRLSEVLGWVDSCARR